MQYTGRLFVAGVVALFNILRYFYYHRYMGLPFHMNFFVLTTIFLVIAWWSGKQFDRATYYSEKDPLTQVYNRRTVEKKYLRLLSSYKKDKRKIGIMMIDLNDFKKVNDSLGHHKGDELLAKISSLLKENVQKNDVVARWGGDEFVILVPNAEKDFELSYVKKFQKKMSEKNLDVRMSLGSAVYPDDGTTFEVLLQMADSAMYRRKVLK